MIAMRRLFVSLLFVVLSAGVLWMEVFAAEATVTLSADTYIEKSYGDTNNSYGAADYLYARTVDASNPRRILIKFDLSGISGPVSVSNVVCSVQCMASVPEGDSFLVYQLTADWVEGNLTGGTDSAMACWAWSGTPSGLAGAWGGGTFNSVHDTTTGAPASTPKWITFGNAATAQIVEDWINGDASNYGFLFTGWDPNNNQGWYGLLTGASTEPRMVITYTEAASPTEQTTTIHLRNVHTRSVHE